MEYKDYQSDDFLNDDSFIRWVLIGENDAFWIRFSKEYPQQADRLNQARELVVAIRQAEQANLNGLDQQRVWNKINLGISAAPESENTIPRPMYQRSVTLWLAASVMLLFGIGWVLLRGSDDKKVNYQDLTASVVGAAVIEKVNTNNQPLRITLEDSSVISLAAGARISYPQHFEKNKRKVVLTGEAFFDVASDASRPFYIYSNEVITKVLGTSFTIKASDDSQNVVVQVRTGRVSVYSAQQKSLADPETAGVILLPNQQAIYQRNNEVLSRKLVKVPIPLLTLQAPVHYDEIPVADVFSDIEKRYGISLIYNEDTLKNCFITTTIGNEPLYDIMDLVCRIIGANYKEVDAQLVIDSKGCD